MAFNLSSFSTEKQNHGRKVDFAGSTFWVCHIGNFKFQNRYNELRRPFKRKIDQDTLPAETAQELLCRAMAEYILVNWEGVEDNGVVVPYSKETAFQALNTNAELRDFIQSIAVDTSQFVDEEESADLKS